MIAASEALSKVSHPGLRGRLRELFIAEFFLPLWPPTLGVGHGEMVDSAGGTFGMARACQNHDDPAPL